MVGRPTKGANRVRGGIDTLPSGVLRVRVYAGIDPVTERRHYRDHRAATASAVRRHGAERQLSVCQKKPAAGMAAVGGATAASL
jgi:hypothetical protein